MEYGFHRRMQNIMKFQSEKGKKKKRKQEKNLLSLALMLRKAWY